MYCVKLVENRYDGSNRHFKEKIYPSDYFTHIVDQNPRDEVQGGVQLFLKEGHFVEGLLPFDRVNARADGGVVNSDFSGTLLKYNLLKLIIIVKNIVFLK